MPVVEGEFYVCSSRFELKNIGYFHYFGGLRQAFLFFFSVKLLDHFLSGRISYINSFADYLILSFYFLVGQYAVVNTGDESFILVRKFKVPPSCILYALRRFNHSFHSLNIVPFIFEFC